MARTKQQTASGSLIELVTIVAVALGLALGIQAFLVKPFRIPSESMVPTLEVSQRVLVNRVSLHFGDPGRGDIVVFKPPKGSDDNVCGVRHPGDSPCPRPTDDRANTNFIKRVVAVGGDRLKIVDNHVYIDGRRQQESFVNGKTSCEEPTCNMKDEITIPKGHFFMMGDNRGESADSRQWGPIPKEWMVGKAFMTYWPPKRIGAL